MSLSYSKSCLIGAIMETMAYGMYFLLLCRCSGILWKRHIKGAISIYLITATIILFVLITMRMVLDNYAAVTAFTYAPLTPDAAEIYFGSFGNGAMFRTGTYVALTVVADIFIVFRVYAVWGNSIYAAIVPALLAVADIGLNQSHCCHHELTFIPSCWCVDNPDYSPIDRWGKS
ncbi:hypothetical protein DFH05DRAFT_1390308 [Lentinula detonsa]|uniref:Uncharacterized protein n=1 Tax=Lentinula detonsa TaxID=2804962 RepID=A0A9W8P919_9AGAR|nr:hypothetical protein DFH05DRAFT_1390308 [Lentinula detonsa]